MPARGTDELAQLAEAFNEMATSLEHAEEIRRQLLAVVGAYRCCDERQPGGSKLECAAA